MVPNSKSAFHIVTSGGSGTGWARVDAAKTRRTAWSGFAGTHNRLSSRCRSVVWLLTRRPGAVPGPVAGDLPEAGHDCREGRESGFRPEGGNRPSDEPFELPGAQDRAQGVFPQPPKTAFSARPVDTEWINPIGRGSDEVRQERRIRAEQRMRGRKTERIRPVGNEAGRMWGTPKPFENKGNYILDLMGTM